MNDALALLVCLAILVIIAGIFIRISIRLRRGGGSMTTVALSATDGFRDGLSNNWTKRMSVTKYSVLLACITATAALGQTATETFERFAVKQDSLFIAAYEKRDTRAYDKLLAEFLEPLHA